MRWLLAALLLSCVAAAAQPADYLRVQSTLQRAPVTIDMIGRLAGKPGFVQLQRPVVVAASGQHLYLFDAGPKLFYRFNMAQQTLQELPMVDGALKGIPAGIIIAPDQSLYVADPEGHQVLHVAYDGQVLRTLSDDTNMARPVAVAFAVEDDIVLVADSLYDHIVGFNHLGWLLFGFGQRGMEADQLQLIVDMAVGEDGLYVVDRLNPYVKIYTARGKLLRSFARKEVGNPGAIAVDSYGRVYIADNFDDTLKVYVEGRYEGAFGGTGSEPERFRYITDLFVDQGRLYVTDSMNGRITILAISPPGIPLQNPESLLDIQAPAAPEGAVKQ